MSLVNLRLIYNKKFQQLDCYSLFEARFSINEYGQRLHQFFIDFGCDAEGAALLLSDVISNVYGVSEENLECVVNEGNDAIEKSRKKMATSEPSRPPMTTKDYIFLLSLSGGALLFVCLGVWLILSDIGILESFCGILTIAFFGWAFIKSIQTIFFS